MSWEQKAMRCEKCGGAVLVVRMLESGTGASVIRPEECPHCGSVEIVELD